MKPISRRAFVKHSALATAAIPLSLAVGKNTSGQRSTPTPAESFENQSPYTLRWLEGQVPVVQSGTTWGLPWPKGKYPKTTTFSLKSGNGAPVPLQTWPTAYWPDGSLKWTAHSIPAGTGSFAQMQIGPGVPAQPTQALRVAETVDAFVIHTGEMECTIPKTGTTIIASLKHGENTVASNGRLVGSRSDNPDHSNATQPLEGQIRTVTLEQRGSIRSVIKVEGIHITPEGREWLPFCLRLRFYAGSTSMQMTHTFVFDGDEHHDFISSLGVQFDVPMPDEAHNRHVRFVNGCGGVWGEAIRGITGLRRDPGKEVRDTQIAGRPTPPLDQWSEAVSTRLHWIPTWSDFTLSQPNANGFSLRKRTKEGHAWIPADQGQHAAGGGYVGGISGGLAFAMRDFWRLHPTQIDIRNAATPTATLSLWIWAPDSKPMDIRFYHDGLGQDTHAKQLDALNITYEDYEPGFGTPHGVARSTDLTFWALPATPSRDDLSAMATQTDQPPLLVARPQDYLEAGVFGALWSLPDRSTPKKRQIEDRLDWSVRYYADQVKQRHWYGFWDYGDIMHTYDPDRHVWRYDVGGYAWDNSELSPDLWLWYSFMRTGDATTFRLAEALTRHNRDVDIYHLGRFKGFGTRHNVQHWGCSAKQLRISTAAYRRFHYFLTADERTGDVLNEVVEADRQLATLNPVRKLPGQPEVPAEVRMGQGTDFGSVATNWLTAWERTGDEKYKNWLVNAMKVIGSHDLGFFVPDYGYDVETKAFILADNPKPRVSHLSSVFGMVEANKELMDLLDIPEFNKAWLEYCILYNAGPEAHVARFGEALNGISLVQAHSRLTAFAAQQKSDPALAKRAMREFESEWGGPKSIETERISGTDVLNPVDEAAWVSTNDAAQWGLAAIQNLALIPQAY
ncbi:MAG: Tat pathway signal sequence domain protein [Opitutales bacterium]|nr:Tat pathway signal sequence domain protein [Opitutales bacterium]